MLKDIFNKINKKSYDKILNSIMDGFVDIKLYKNINGKEEMIYHDCGDNVVTDWMRNAIMVMLTGSVFSKNGNDTLGVSSDANIALESRNSSANFTLPNSNTDAGNAIYHADTSAGNTAGINGDGYLLNGKQYFWPASSMPVKYSSSAFSTNKYAMFPTKVLFGTAKEYSKWSVLKTENESANATWYANMLSLYGGDETTAAANFNANIDLSCNTYSGSISKNVTTGNGYITSMRTVNDPDTSANIISSSSTMNKNYGVVGAVKTIYFSRAEDSAMLQSTISTSGKLLKPTNRGVGRPCFIYFNTPTSDSSLTEGWDNSTSEVYVSKDSSSQYLNKITFSMSMPSQTAADNAAGLYYPYNGFTLKQVGLFNDALLTSGVGSDNDKTEETYVNMPCGMLECIKNIEPFTKDAEMTAKLTWTLTI